MVAQLLDDLLEADHFTVQILNVPLALLLKVAELPSPVPEPLKCFLCEFNSDSVGALERVHAQLLSELPREHRQWPIVDVFERSASTCLLFSELHELWTEIVDEPTEFGTQMSRSRIYNLT